MFGLGVPEIIAILLVGLLIFGANKLPELGKSIGQTIGEFRKGTAGTPERHEEKKATAE